MTPRAMDGALHTGRRNEVSRIVMDDAAPRMARPTWAGATK